MKDAIEKAKEDKVTTILAQEINGGSLGYKILSYDTFREISKRILTALEAEKPAEDALELASKIEHGAHDYVELWCRVLPQWLESFAESYHAKKCAECKKVEPRKYYPLGQEPISSTKEEHGMHFAGVHGPQTDFDIDEYKEHDETEDNDA